MGYVLLDHVVKGVYAGVGADMPFEDAGRLAACSGDSSFWKKSSKVSMLEQEADLSA
jgi:hypothetical protein